MLVDAADLDKVERYRWHLKAAQSQPGRFYAQTTIRLTPGRKGKKTSLALHRYIIGAGPDRYLAHPGEGVCNGCADRLPIRVVRAAEEWERRISAPGRRSA